MKLGKVVSRLGMDNSYDAINTWMSAVQKVRGNCLFRANWEDGVVEAVKIEG